MKLDLPRVLPLHLAVAGLAATLTLCAGLSSCVPSPDTAEAPNSIEVTPNALAIVPGDSAATAVRLTCGCRFPITSINFVGDTNAIGYVLDTAITAHVTPHHVTFFVKPGSASGQHQAYMAFYVLDDNNVSFYDTVRVSANVP